MKILLTTEDISCICCGAFRYGFSAYSTNTAKLFYLAPSLKSFDLHDNKQMQRFLAEEFMMMIECLSFKHTVLHINRHF